MDAYNLVNGEHATQNSFLNNEIAKKEWKFNGLIMSDWFATYDGVGAANGGMDLEMPSSTFMNRQNLLPAIKSGAVSQATIDDKVRRVKMDLQSSGDVGSLVSGTERWCGSGGNFVRRDKSVRQIARDVRAQMGR